jgi:hypothetical protein
MAPAVAAVSSEPPLLEHTRNFVVCRAVHALPRGLGPFGDDFQVHRVRQGNDGHHDGHVVRVFAHARDERTIDLERFDRQTAQAPERRVAGAEVVDRDAQAAFAHG